MHRRRPGQPGTTGPAGSWAHHRRPRRLPSGISAPSPLLYSRKCAPSFEDEAGLRGLSGNATLTGCRKAPALDPGGERGGFTEASIRYWGTRRSLINIVDLNGAGGPICLLHLRIHSSLMNKKCTPDLAGRDVLVVGLPGR
jgi:hypothetical protein